MLRTLIQTYDKNHFSFGPVLKREINRNFTGCQMPHFMIVLILYINLSYDVVVNQWITSFHKNRMTIRYITLWREKGTSCLYPHSHYILNLDQLDTDQVDPDQTDLHHNAFT